MDECSLENVEYAELFGVDSPEMTQDVTLRWEILSRNADLPWNWWTTFVGESGELFKYDHLEAN